MKEWTALYFMGHFNLNLMPLPKSLPNRTLCKQVIIYTIRGIYRGENNSVTVMETSDPPKLTEEKVKYTKHSQV